MRMVIFAAACLAWALLWAYTRGMQEATLFWGSRLGEDNPLLPRTGMQDAITPPVQNVRNIVALSSLLAIPAVGVWQLGWVAGLVGTIAMLAASAVIRSFLPKPQSLYFSQVIIRGLSRRRDLFAGASDEHGVQAADAVLTRLKTEFETVHGHPVA